MLYSWCEPWVCPSNLTTVFAFEDDYSMGVLTSLIHGEWARRQSSTLRVDIRYTPTSAFGTFPWPPTTDEERRVSVAALAEAVVARRGEICSSREIGLTTLYNQTDEGAWADLKALHAKLDEAVAAAYGWPASVAHDPDEACRLLLLELNHRIAAGEVPYDPFGTAATAG